MTRPVPRTLRGMVKYREQWERDAEAIGAAWKHAEERATKVLAREQLDAFQAGYEAGRYENPLNEVLADWEFASQFL